MRHLFFVAAWVVAFGVSTLVHGGEAKALGGGWKHQDVGAVEVAGQAEVRDGVFTVRGTLDTWGTNDGFHFVYLPMHGDATIVARVVSVENTAGHAKGGVMFRETLAAGAAHAEACVTPVDGTQFLARTRANDKTAAFHGGRDKGKFPYWLKLERRGNAFTAYDSADGQAWTEIGRTNITMQADYLAGVVASSHDKAKLCSVVADQVKVGGRP